MANILNLGTGSNVVKEFGFTNVPQGNWKFKSKINGDVFPGFSNNVIPIVVEKISTGNYGSQHTQGGAASRDGYARVNGKTAVYGKYSIGGLAQYNNMTISANADGYNIFVPMFFDMDLSKTQTSVKSGTVVLWLEKK